MDSHDTKTNDDQVHGILIYTLCILFFTKSILAISVGGLTPGRVMVGMEDFVTNPASR
jgi:hypothetical protein